MIRKIYIIAILAVCSFGFTSDLPKFTRTFTMPNGISSTDYQNNTIVIKYNNSSSVPAVQADLKKSLRVSGVQLEGIESIFPTSSTSSNEGYQIQSNRNDFTPERYFRVKYSGKMPIEKVINQLLKDKNVAYAEPAYVYRVDFVPNDTRYVNQFFLPQVKAPQAWDIRRNASDVIIGIVDTGGEITHEDLADNIYLNMADPINGIDDDGDGYLDNYYGWDFCGATAATMIGDNDPNVKSAAADHGVHVSGIASAVTNNGKGVASIANNAKLLVVKAGADDKPLSIYKGYEGIKYAADMGAKIINCSWGGPGGGQFGQEIINYAIAKGCLVVAAAGNSANDVPIFPAAFEGVLAVANLKSDYVKGQYSNYGYYVDISAPGEGILSTTYSNTYTAYSGTSMASPLVASAAALLKSNYPQLNGLQIGEILRATSDNVDAQNPDYRNKLGAGRLNVYRAITESANSVRYQHLSVVDENLGNRAAGTTIKLKFDLTNYLSPLSGLSVNITTNSPYVQVINNQLNVGGMTSLETKNMAPVSVKILANAPTNVPVTFTFTYTANNGSYQASESFTELVALDYLNVSVNKVQTTFTSNGRVGYSQENASGGLGFMYKDENMLYETALMVAKSDVQVSNNARFDAGYANDFKRIETAARLNNTLAAFEAQSLFDDSRSAFPIGVEVKSHLKAFNTTDNDKYVIVEYEITNKSADDLTAIYTGLFTDWDLDDASFNATEYDANKQLAYVYAKKNAAYPYAGVRLLSLKSSPAYYPLSYQIPNSFLADNVFSIAEKYATLTHGIQSSGIGYDTADGLDVMFTLGSGPYNIAKNKSIKVVYAFVAGDNLTDLKAVSDRAATNYAQLYPETPIPSTFLLSQNYPNAAKGRTKIDVHLPIDTECELFIYDATGKMVKRIDKQLLTAGQHTLDISLQGFSPGVYFYEIRSAKFNERKKMIVVR